MPHTIIDLTEPVDIPSGYIVWGFIANRQDMAMNSYPLEKFSEIRDGLVLGDMLFEGDGELFVEVFQHRIEHILEANGAYFNGRHNQGHAQNNQNISFNTIQPYPDGDREGLYPTIEILP